MPRTASFLQVKQKIKEIAKVEEDRQTLLHNDVTVADDNAEVRDVVWEPYGFLQLRIAPLPGNPRFEIVAKSQNREDDSIKVKETQSVDHLRNKIATRWRIFPPTNITLLRLAHEMEDGRLLSDYLICKGAEIDVLIHNA
ncbi:hypothetical protein FNV43_RR15755 [Rhamnella rubrinervis]|uniref:Ubiquitin-like domain-containing protein n=1 Tax=Rhamnella rubrinervis TaxID=2594499 RepID=A0A8K0E9N4_9ROSA|nr:hypothetical protein FNV43_RR15755 [Rhamnella rubrinervis]